MTPRVRGVVVIAPMVVLLPVIIVRLPANTAPVDLVNLLFLSLHWSWLLARGVPIALPLVTPLWLIVIGSVTGMWSAPSLTWSVLTTCRGLYLYAWFVTLTDFLARSRCVVSAIRVWVVVAVALGAAGAADRFGGLAQGILLESAARAQGTFENPNMFGNYLVVSFFLAWAAAAAGWWRLYLTLPILAGGVVATGSNGALLSLTTGSGLTLLIRPGRWRRVRLGGAVAVVGIVLAVVGPWHTTVAAVAAKVFSRDRGELGGAVLKGYAERAIIWSEALDTLGRHPAGSGPGSFELVSGDVSGTYNSAHNDYLGMLVERGPIGLLGWCGVLAAVALLVDRLRRAGPAAPLAWAPLAGLVAATAAHAMVVELFHFRHVWFAFALLAAAVPSRSERALPAVKLVPRRRGFAKVAA